MSTVIKIENLYKEYQLGVLGHGTIYRDLQSWWAKIRGKPDPNSLLSMGGVKEKKERILALENINLEVKSGEVLGIIGANGAGKSTLLKILSKVTAPTSGSIKYKGRIASLLEVGTGFHTELTGRENIYLNGAINGMTKLQINSKLDEIVDFAGVDQFLDTPVKRYSSGMYVRLGFAVAAYLDPDILVVDEVLAVGDASFQQKALNKMKSVSDSDGRTILFVSHNMESIKKLCSRVIVISDGSIVEDCNPEEGVNKYLNINKEKRITGERHWAEPESAPGSHIVKLKSVSTKDKNNKICNKFKMDESIIVETEFWVLQEGHQICNVLTFYYHSSEESGMVGKFTAHDNYIKGEWGKQKPFKKGIYISRCEIPGSILNEGIFYINIDIFLPPKDKDGSHQTREKSRNFDTSRVLSFEIYDDYNNDSVRQNYPYDWPEGDLIRPDFPLITKLVN